jgi:hypothetical protein
LSRATQDIVVNANELKPAVKRAIDHVKKRYPPGHTDAVLGTVLGLSEAQLSERRESGIVKE